MSKSNKDSLGDRMKEYEGCFSYKLTKNTDYIIRLDGRHFHSLTRHFNKPFDTEFVKVMRDTAKSLMTEIQGVKLIYVQSDEISIFMNDKDSEESEPWFDNKLQKTLSVSASYTTMMFNKFLSEFKKDKYGMFDSRIFALPSEEIPNYFIWRQRDWERNSLSMMCQANFSHKLLHKKNRADMHEMLHSIGKNWNDLDGMLKNGTFYYKGGDGVIAELREKMNYESLKGLLSSLSDNKSLSTKED